MASLKAVGSVLAAVCLVLVAGLARGAETPCVLTVAEVRGADVYLARPKGCAVAPGALLQRAGEGEGALRVVAVSDSWSLATSDGSAEAGAAPAGAASWKAGERFVVAAAGASPDRTGGREGPPDGGWRAGPGARSQQLPTRFWREAAEAARPEVGPPSDSTGVAAVRGPVVRGSLGAGAVAVIDRSDRDAGFVRPSVDSRLTVTHPGGIPLDYRHRIRWQRRFRYDQAPQPWEDDYPEWAVRELSVSYGVLDERLRMTAGRFQPIGVGGATTVDGGGIEGTVAEGLDIGAYGGLLPDPTSLVPDVDAVGVGAWIRGRHTSRDLSVGGSLLLGGSAWKGKWDTTYADGLFTLRAARAVDVYLSTRADLYGDFNPADRPRVDLSRLWGGVRGRPIDWLELGARYYRYRFVTTRRRSELWGTDYTLTSSTLSGEPMQGVGLTARADLPAGFEIDGFGDVDVADRPGYGFRAGGTLAWRSPLAGAWRLAARYAFDDGASLRSHSVGGEVRLGVLAELTLELAYRYLRYTYRALDSAAATEHDARFVIDWQALPSLHVWAETSWWTGDEVESILAQTYVGWNF